MARVAIVFCLLLAVVAATSKKDKEPAINGKIIGGVETDISRVPYQVSLLNKGRHDCGGSVIAPRFVLTAAHCVDGEKPSDLTVRGGSRYNAWGGLTRRVMTITMHSGYNKDTLDNDIAVLKLNFPFPLGSLIKLIPLSEREPVQGELVFVSGWGATREGGGSSRSLRLTVVPTITRQSCQRSYLNVATITSGVFCAGFYVGGRDACQGDSGGPAVASGRLVGIVSWGIGCGKRNSPGVYTNVFRYRRWIQSQIS